MKFAIKSVLIICLIILLSGFSLRKKQQIYTVFFSKLPISVQNPKNYTQTFNSGERIYYLINSSNEFNCKYLRIRILKKDEKVNMNGFSIKRTFDTEVINKTNVLGEAVLYEKGLYILQVYEFCNPTKILVNGVFRVEE